MKNLFKLLGIAAAFTGFISCEDKDNILFSEPVGTFAIVTPATGSSVVLSESTQTNPGLSLTWGEMDYTTPQVVNYTVQIARGGTNFQAPIDLGTTTNKFATFNTAQFNLACLQAGAVPFVQTTINIRIKSTTGNAGSQPTFSNSINYLVTAFGCLNQFAVGKGIVESGWNWNTPRTLLCDNGVLTMTATLGNAADDAFRFFTVQGDWNSGRNFLYYTSAAQNYKIISTLVNAGDGDNNFRNTGFAGRYLLTINENEKFIRVARRTVASGIEPTSYWLVGAATPGGWSWTGNNETELSLVAPGIYETVMRMNPAGDANFRLWLANDGGDSWGSPNRNFPSFANDGYTIDNELAQAPDGDSNFRYLGPAGVRRFRVNTITKVITVD